MLRPVNARKLSACTYTYNLQSEGEPDRHSIGSTSDLRRRVAEHNAGKCRHTAKYAPWTIKACFAFQEPEVARRFEAYLKTGSGREFARRHFE